MLLKTKGKLTPLTFNNDIKLLLVVIDKYYTIFNMHFVYIYYDIVVKLYI